MASAKVVLKHSTSGLLKEAPLGFSWTTLLFGFLPALFRGDIKWAIIQFLVSMVTFGFSWPVFPFFYNKLYVRGLLEKGYVPADEGGNNLLAARGIMMSNSETTTSTPTAETTNAAADGTTDTAVDGTTDQT